MAAHVLPTRAFQAVDASGEAARLAAYLRTLRVAVEPGQAPAERLLEVLGLRPGMRVLDVGCGLGDDVLAMARDVGPLGVAAGVDTSAEFLMRALDRARAEKLRADFVLGDAHQLPFPDAGFDVVRTERTLQHVADPAGVVAEMARVTVPGGVVCAFEPDWDTLVVDLDPARVTAAVLDALRTGFRHPAVGRQLVRHFARAGLGEVRAEPSTVVFRDADEAELLLMLPDALARAEAEGLSRARSAAWLEELRRRSAEGTLFASVTGFLVFGRVAQR